MSDGKSNQFGPVQRNWLIMHMFTNAEGKAILSGVLVPIFAFVAAGLFTCVTAFHFVVVSALGVALAGLHLRKGGSEPQRVNLKGKTAIVTGANTGIGAESVRLLAQMGAHVVLCCRDSKKGDAAREAIQKQLPAGSGDIEVRTLDLASKASIEAFVAGITRDGLEINILLNNAGVMMCPYSTTADGFEMQCGTNHLGHMLLTLRLLPNLKKNAARIVNVSSVGHLLESRVPGISWLEALNPDPKTYHKGIAYHHAKLANVSFTRALEKRLAGSGAHAYTCHPGAVRTELMRHDSARQQAADALGFLVMKTPAEGAWTQVYLATAPEAVPVLYHSDSRVREAAPITYSDENAEELWTTSCKLLGIDA